MAERSVVVIEGVAEARAALTAFGAEKVPRQLKRAVAAGARILRDDIRAEAQSSFVGQSHTNPGGLLRGIRATAVRGEIAYDVGPQGPGTEHRHLVIRGHNVTRRKGGPVLGRTRPNDFVARGQAAGEAEALSAISEGFAAAVAEAGRP